MVSPQFLKRAFRQHPEMRERSAATIVGEEVGRAKRLDRRAPGRVVGLHVVQLHAPVERKSARFDRRQERDGIGTGIAKSFFVPWLEAAPGGGERDIRRLV